MTRLLLTIACLAFIALLLLGMRLGWRNRMRRQADLPVLPAVPTELGRSSRPPIAGVYVGSTFSSSWQDRVVHAGLGLQSNARLSLHTGGVLFDRAGADPLFIPAGDIVRARLAPALAGRVVGQGGLLVVRWRLGAAELDSGFRADDKTGYPEWVREINEGVTA